MCDLKLTLKRALTFFIFALFLVPSLIYGYSVTAGKVGGQTTGVDVIGITSPSPASSYADVRIKRPDWSTAGFHQEHHHNEDITTVTAYADVNVTGNWKIESWARWQGGAIQAADVYGWSVTQ